MPKACVKEYFCLTKIIDSAGTSLCIEGLKLSHLFFAGEIMRTGSGDWRSSLTKETIDKFATKEQREALNNNDESLLKRADDLALATAIMASLAELKDESSLNPSLSSPSSDDKASVPLSSDSKKDSATQATVPQEHCNSSRKANQKLRHWLGNHGFDIIKNSGAKSNCLLISMIQHAKANYSTEHQAEVNELRRKVKEFTKKHYPDNPSINDYSLNSDDELTDALVEEINKGIIHPDDKLSFWFVTAQDVDGNPFWRRVGDGPKMAIIFDQGGHYEAVIPRSVANAR